MEGGKKSTGFKNIFMRVCISDFKHPKLILKVIDHAQAFYCAAEFSLEKGFVVQPPLHWWQYRLWSFKSESANFIIFLSKNDFFSKETLLSFGLEWLEVLIFKIWFWNILGKNLSWNNSWVLVFIRITVFIIGTFYIVQV